MLYPNPLQAMDAPMPEKCYSIDRAGEEENSRTLYLLPHQHSYDGAWTLHLASNLGTPITVLKYYQYYSTTRQTTSPMRRYMVWGYSFLISQRNTLIMQTW